MCIQREGVFVTESKFLTFGSLSLETSRLNQYSLTFSTGTFNNIMYEFDRQMGVARGWSIYCEQINRFLFMTFDHHMH